jgi:hypothetical protein
MRLPSGAGRTYRQGDFDTHTETLVSDKTRYRPNAAYLLADALRAWHVPAGEKPQHRRGFRDESDLDAWRGFTQQADMVRTLDSMLQGMDADGRFVDMFLEALPRWYAGVYMASTPWNEMTNGGDGHAACSEGDINLLQALGALIDSTDYVTIGEEEHRSLSDVLAQARKLLEEDSSHIPNDIRQYLWGLICRAQMILDNLDNYGPEALRQVALELGGALVVQGQRAEGNGDMARAQSWRSTAYLLMVGFMGGGAGGVGQAIGEAGIQAIEKSVGG